jgi:hypothetical protein
LQVLRSSALDRISKHKFRNTFSLLLYALLALTFLSTANA